MPWAGIDDQFFHNRKARAVGPEGREMFIASVCYSNMQLNDGCFVAGDVPVIAALAQVPPVIADRLIEHDLWHAEGHDCLKCRAVGQEMPVPSGHIAIHEYLGYNRSRQQVIAERRAAAERKRRSREKSRRDSHGESLPPQSQSPPPDSFPTSSRPTDLKGTSPPVDKPTTDDEIPGEVWDEYARLKLKMQPDGKVRSPAKWLATARANAKSELGDQALHWWRTFEVRPNELAAWLADGQPSRHARRRKDAS